MTTNTKSEFTFHKAVREQIRLLIAVSGGTGSGKSYSGLRLAKGLANGKRFAAIDTENGRLSMYADFFDFDVVHLHAPFTPARYLAAIKSAEGAGYDVILVDSGSHEWDGDGGVLDMQDEELAGMVERAVKGGDSRPEWQIEEAQRMRSWIHPKIEHKKMVTGFLQLKAHLIMCLRAAERIEVAKEKYTDSAGREKSKTVVRPKQTLTGLDGWVPICEAKLPFEFTASFLLTADRPGIPKPIKLQEQHKAFFPLDKPISEDAGRLIGEWAKGGAPKVDTKPLKPETKPPITETKPGVYEPKEQKPETTAIEWFGQIEKAPTLEALHQIGVQLSTSTLAPEDIVTGRLLFAARKKQLSQPPQSAAGTGNKGPVPQAAEKTEEPWI